MTEEKRCLKFVGYLYVPLANELSDPKEIKRRLIENNTGRIQLFDEFGNKVGNKMLAFSNLGDMLQIICTAYKKMLKSRFK